jgi:DNA-binding transcriptional LysR family regulator
VLVKNPLFVPFGKEKSQLSFLMTSCIFCIMELTWIEDFLTLCREKHFTRAADARATTQPAFSRRLQRLEEWLGCTLVRRGARPFELTREGEAFRVRAERLKEDMLDARRALRSLSSHYARPLRIYTTNTLAVGFFPAWAKAQKLENYSLVVASITACLEALRAGRADRALIPLFQGEPLPSDLTCHEVAEEKLALMATPSVAKKVRLEKKMLKGPLLMYTPGTGYGTEVSARLKAMHIKLEGDPLCESASAEALAAQVREGFGAAWLPESLTTKGLVACSVPKALESGYRIVLVGGDQKS